MTRVTITLQRAERDALIALGIRERRNPRAQAALMLCERLRAEGLLPETVQKNPLAASASTGFATSGFGQPPANELNQQEPQGLQERIHSKERCEQHTT